MTSREIETTFPTLQRRGLRSSPYVAAVERFARKRPVGAVAGGTLLFVTVLAVFADVVTPYGVNERDSSILLQSPSFPHPFGTDQLGRDVMTRVIYGARLSLYIGLAVTVLSSLFGLTLGVVSGYFRGKVDIVMVVMLDAMMAFPGLVLAIALVTALGASVTNVILAVLVGFSARIARIVRTTVFTISAMPYVEAARVSGASDLRILVRHIVPNVFPIIIVLASLNFGVAMLVESSLSYLGLGPPPPLPSWGRMLSDEGQNFFRSAPWLGIFPGLALALAVFSLNLFGDSLRDHLDPKLRS